MLFDLGSKINAIYLIFAKKLGFSIRLIDVGAPKIDGTILNIYGIIITAFLVTDKANQIRFIEEIFLVANICLKVVFEIIFFILSDADVDVLD